MLPFDARVAAVAGGQLGLITRRQLAREAQVSRSTLHRRLASGVWTEVVPPVIELPGWRDDWDRAVLRAVLAAGPGAAASHLTAAWQLGLLGIARPPRIEVVTPRSQRWIDKGLRPHTSVHLPPEDLTCVGPVPVTAGHRTLMDIAARLTPDALHLALIDWLRRPGSDLGLLQAALTARANQPGVGRLVAMLASLPATAHRVESPAEVRLVPFLRRFGLPEPVFQYEVYDRGGGLVGRVDAAWPDARAILEVDSIWHDTPERRARDAARDATLGDLGWAVERVRSGDLQGSRAPATAARIRRLLADT